MSLPLSIDGTDRRTDGHPTVTDYKCRWLNLCFLVKCCLSISFYTNVIDYNNKMTKMPMHFLYGTALAENSYSLVYSVVKLLSKR